jgi:GTP pyrophosphokinase
MSQKTMVYVKGYAQGAGLIQTLKALNAAVILHKGQTRKTGEPYVYHPVKVAAELLALGINDDEILATAILHDVLEDCNISKSQLIADYGINSNVVAYVSLLTKDKGFTTEHYYKSLAGNAASALVKISDRCHNVSTMAGGFNFEKMQKYVKETEEFVIPLCKHVKDFYPQYSNQVFVMKYHIESICHMCKTFLEAKEKGE